MNEMEQLLASRPVYYYSDVEQDSLYVKRRPVTVLLLQIATLGIYSVYWFYANWKKQQANTGSSIIPLLRALYYPFFAYSLYADIADTSSQVMVSSRYNLRIHGVLVFATYILMVPEFENQVLIPLLVFLYYLFGIVYVQIIVNRINFRIFDIKTPALATTDWYIVAVIGLEIALLYHIEI